MFPPPHPLPPLLNPTSMAGHRQPIKLGLGGYLHTLGCSETVSEHAPIPPCSPSQASFHPSHVSHSFHLSLYFTCSRVCILPFASSFSEPSHRKLFTQRGIQELLILPRQFRQIPRASVATSPPPPPLCLGSCHFFYF